MVAFRLADPKMQLFNDNGTPLAGGKVYTYVAGTTTPQDTFQDYDQTILNENPIILDDAGRASVFWAQALYDVNVTDRTGSQLYSASSFGTPASSSSSTTGFGEETSIASDVLVDLGSITSHNAVLTGTTSVAGFGSSASVLAPIYIVHVQSAGVVFQFGSNLLNPNGVDITSTQNDYFFTSYLGSGIWKIWAYFRGDGSIDATTIRCANLTVTTQANLP